MMHQPREPLQYLGSDYDIREVDEELYLAVLARRRAESGCDAADLSVSGDRAEGSAGISKGQEMG